MTPEEGDVGRPRMKFLLDGRSERQPARQGCRKGGEGTGATSSASTSAPNGSPRLRLTDDAGEVALNLLLPALGALGEASQERDGTALRETADDNPLRVEIKRVLGDERLDRIGRRDETLAVLVGRVRQLVERREVEPAL
jgi:hypothetical protein